MYKNITVGALGSDLGTDGSSLDTAAYLKLQNIIQSARQQYYKDAGEYGLEKLIEGTDRKATGDQLARDLYHDGKRIEVRKRKKQVWVDDTILQEAPVEEADDYATTWELDNHVRTLQGVIEGLSANQQIALSLHANNEQDERVIKRILGVGARQYRNIVSAAKAKLSAPAIKNAYKAVMQAFQGPHCEYLAVRIHEVLAGVFVVS